ncbi:hypothetical protein CCACVL1_06916 [Corchorus capsularis]|uniref:Uncharacterized protein n=1 Tax=Corchorus capsularis TaxID=210143 RepID=A0A1R3JBA6_COCAP|nr:hypothetical protein CCACVL1_06916 [Corchorus capsularis]
MEDMTSIKGRILAAQMSCGIHEFGLALEK